ncbi:MAG: flagellar basal body P-ring protein FlgI [Pirellulales bacterium]
MRPLSTIRLLVSIAARCGRYVRTARVSACSGRWLVITRGACSIVLAAAAGCTGPVVRSQNETLMLTEVQSQTPLVGAWAHPYGMEYVKVEGVSLATGLDGTGEDPAPSPQRAALLAEMQRRQVGSPSRVLASPDTALVLVRGYLRPGMQKGDRFDVEVRVPSRSDTESLRGGWLLSTRMTELSVLGHQIRSGHLMASAEGAVLVDPVAKSDTDRPLLTRGRVLEGAVTVRSRSLGLSIDTEDQSVRDSQEIGAAINRRFHTRIGGQRRGVATPKTDEFIELRLHPRYKDNIGRYMRVVRNIAIRETPSEHQQRLELLGQQLSDPFTASTAAVRLEAIGNEDAVAVLEDTIGAEDPEVRFYAAEALAYLDKTEAVEPLARAARDEPAFRLNALAAISAMDDAIAHDALQDLLHVKSAETRYGAFRALSAMRSTDPLIRSEDLGGPFSYHVLDTKGPPMIHVTRSHRAEIVLFGRDQKIRLPLVADAGRRILVNGLKGERITVSRFEPGKEDEQRVVVNKVDDLIRAIVELGGTYPDVVQALVEAKAVGALEGQLHVDALPESGRRPHRTAEAEPVPSTFFSRLANPLPSLFGR